MKTSRLFLMAVLALSMNGVIVAQNAARYEAEDALWFGNISSTTLYNDIPSSGGFYVHTGECSIKWTIDIETAGLYNINVIGCSGDVTPGREMQFCVDRETTPKNTDPLFATERFSVPFGQAPYSETVKAFKNFPIVANRQLSVGEHTVVMDKTDGGSWGWVKVDYIEVISSAANGLSEVTAPKSIIIANNGVVKVTPVSAESYSLNVYSISGCKIWSQKDLSNQTEVNGLPKGVYLFKVETALGVDNQKVIVE